MNKQDLRKYERLLDRTEAYWRDKVHHLDGKYWQDHRGDLCCPLCDEQYKRMRGNIGEYDNPCKGCLVLQFYDHSCNEGHIHNKINRGAEKGDKRYIYRILDNIRRQLQENYRRVQLPC